jgi:nitrite reductase/ring-hydroxylating ferredoxin subunit
MPLTFASRFATSQRWADPLAKRLQPLINRAVSAPSVHNFLDGVWLGAPLHPPLTDVPVGAWTTALLLDTGAALSGDRDLGAAADRALAVGTIAAVPTALTGLNDLRDLTGQSRRIAMVHALANVLGLSLSTASLACRHTGRRGLARGLSGLGYLTSSVAAHLGGELSFGLGIRVNRTMGEAVPKSFVPVLDEDELRDDELRRVDVDGVPVMVARSQRGEVCALANTCTHLGGPLAEGSREGDTVACPWHGSRFDIRTGAVVEGPAVFVQPRLATRVRDGKIEIGFPDAEADELPELALEPPPDARGASNE